MEFLAHPRRLPPLVAAWALAGGGLATGLGKEIWDACYGSGFCWYDMLGNAIGIAGADDDLSGPGRALLP